MDYGDAFIDMQKDINNVIMNEFGVEVIDWKRGLSRKYNKFAWNRFVKCPYTQHEKLNDMSYPLDKNMDMTVSLECSEADWR